MKVDLNAGIGEPIRHMSLNCVDTRVMVNTCMSMKKALKQRSYDVRAFIVISATGKCWLITCACRYAVLGRSWLEDTSSRWRLSGLHRGSQIEMHGSNTVT